MFHIYFQKYDSECILIYESLENTYKLFDLDFNFNINSNDEIEKYKSLLLLLSITNGTIDLISTNPNLFNAYLNKYDIKTAYEEITLRVLIGNILDIKKSLNKLNTISNEMKDMLDKFYNILNNIFSLWSGFILSLFLFI